MPKAGPSFQATLGIEEMKKESELGPPLSFFAKRSKRRLVNC
jgi:hypothetical protein